MSNNLETKCDIDNIMKKTYRVCDFFCGAGGFSEGFRQAGFDVIFSLDSWKIATETHDINHNNHKCCHLDILKLDTPEKIDEIIPDSEVIVGSPPCVSFSNSNKSGKADKTLGIKLINQYLKIILHKLTKPNSILKYWILENVPNSIDYIKDSYTAEELGLNNSLPNLEVPIREILIASDYGAPQGRKRAIVGNYITPNKTHNENNCITINEIQNVLKSPLNNKLEKFTDPLFPNIILDKDKLTDHFYDTTIPQCLWERAKKLKTDHGYMGKMDFPDRTNRLCRTIMATESYSTREAIIFPKENSEKEYRGPTIRELSCLMGFPIDYQFKGTHTNKHKQIGNAVCPQLSKALGDAIRIKDNMKPKIVNIRYNEDKITNYNFTKGLFSDYTPKPRKYNSTYHSHVPFIKVGTLRVELDNRESDFDNNKIIWKSYLHKGTGKNAIKLLYSNNNLTPHIENNETYKLYIKDINNLLKNKVYNSLIYQKKNCSIDTNDKIHLSPSDTLESISKIINKYLNDDVKIECKELDNLFKNKKPYKYSLKVLYSLYSVNKIIELLEKP